MARYSRPRLTVYDLKQPNGVAVRARKVQEIRYISKPLRSEVLPHLVWWVDRKLLSKGESLSNPWPFTDARSSYPLTQVRNNGPHVEGITAAARNKAYSRYLDKMNNQLEASQWAVGLAERRTTTKMMKNRVLNSTQQIYGSAMTLAAAYRSLRRGDFGQFLSILKLKRLPKRLQRRVETPRGRWSAPEAASALWLEYWFGWSPLVADIHSAVSILEAELPEAVRVTASATARTELDRELIGTDQYLSGTYTVRVRMGATVSVENPNLRRATLLGLTNPASVAWELIPFSFLIDWFIPVSKFLDSWSDFFGLSVKDPWTSTLTTFTGVENYRWAYQGGAYHVDTKHVTGQYQRDMGISSPVIYPKVFKGLSVTRGATAVSLLLQVLKPSKFS